MTTTPARDALMWRLTTPGETPLTADWAQRQIDQHAAEVRAAAIREAADKASALVADGEHDPDCLVYELRRLAAAARPDDTTDGRGGGTYLIANPLVTNTSLPIRPDDTTGA